MKIDEDPLAMPLLQDHHRLALTGDPSRTFGLCVANERHEHVFQGRLDHRHPLQYVDELLHHRLRASLQRGKDLREASSEPSSRSMSRSTRSRWRRTVSARPMLSSSSTLATSSSGKLSRRSATIL
jgi:hypothetical protein